MRHREAFSHITMSVKEGIIRTAVATAGVQIRESPTIDTPSPDVCFLCQTGKIQSPMHQVCALCDNHLTSDDALTQDLSFRAIPDKSGSKLQAWADGRPVALPTSVLTASAYTPVSNHDIASIGLDLAIIAGGSRTEAQRGIPARSALLLDIISYAENAAELCEIRVCTSTKKLMPEVEAAFRARRQMLGPPPTRIGLHSIESCLNAAAEVIKRGERSLPSIDLAALRHTVAEPHTLPVTRSGVVVDSTVDPYANASAHTWIQDTSAFKFHQIRVHVFAPRHLHWRLVRQRVLIKHATLLHKEEQIANFGRVRLSTLSNPSFVGRTRHLLFQALAQLRQRLLQRRRRDNVARAISRTEEPDVAVVRESPNGLQPTLSVARDDADAIMTEATTDLEGSVTNLKPRHTCAVINLLWRDLLCILTTECRYLMALASLGLAWLGRD